MKDPVVPDPPDPTDSAFAFRYFKTHYWDQVDFSDNRLLRTPVLETRLDRYFSQLVPPVVDSINAEADQLLARASADKEVFKYVLWWLTYHYETSPYMGMDAVFVHLVEKYYMTGQAYWLTKEQTDKIVQRAAQIAPNLIGNKAPDLKLRTPDMKPLSLWNVKADYTILIFWDPTCGHCQVVVPQLDSAYNDWKQQGVKIVGVLAGGTAQQWQDYIRENHLEDWINAWDPDRQSGYRRLYDVYMTPVIYLLDAQKKILAKKLDVAQLGSFLAHLHQLADRKPQ
jgi:peroxiredoxin